MLINFFERLFSCFYSNEEFYKRIERINSTGSFIEYESDYE